MRFYLKLSACVLVAAAYGLCLWQAPQSLFAVLLGIPVCNYLAMLLHELGHLLAYGILKLSVKRIGVSWFVWEKGSGFRLDRQQRLFAGKCVCAYDPDVPPWRYGVALLSGGAVNMLLGIGAMAVYVPFGGAFFLSFGVMNGLHGLANLLIPVSADRVLLRQIKEEREKTE